MAKPEFQTQAPQAMINYLVIRAIVTRATASNEVELAQLDGRRKVSGRWLTYDGVHWSIYPRG